MTQYEVDISITDTDTEKEVLRVTVTREHITAALHGAAQGAEAVLQALIARPGALIIPDEMSPVTQRYDKERAYCLTHDLMWNAEGHDATAWCNTREATQQEVDEAVLAVEDREFTTEPIEIEQMEQRVVGVDPAEGDRPATIVEGIVRDGVLHIGVPRGTDPNALGRIVEGEVSKGIASLPDRIKAAPSPGKALIDRMIDENLHRHPGSLSEGEHRVYGGLTPPPYIIEDD